MRTNTKRYYVEQIYSADKTLNKSKLFKMKLSELENLYKNLNIKPSTSDDYSRANFDDVSDEEDENETKTEVETAPDIPKVVPEVVPEIPKVVPKVVPEIPKKKKFNRRELKQMYLNDFSKDVLGILKDLDEGYINEDIALSEYQILHEEVLGDIEAYTENLELTDMDYNYIDNFFALQEKRFL